MSEAARLSLHIPSFPFPPSVNALYRNGKRGRFKTVAYREYVMECDRWALRNGSAIKWFGDNLSGKLLHIDYSFSIPEKNIICQSKKLKGKPKRYDVSNRIKACEDRLFLALGADDCYVFSFTAKKVVADELGVDILVRALDEKF